MDTICLYLILGGRGNWFLPLCRLRISRFVRSDPVFDGGTGLSSTLGLIAIFAPSGLGVREGVLVYLLSLSDAGPVAVIISVLTRIWMTLIEIGLIGVIYLIGSYSKTSHLSSPRVGKVAVGGYGLKFFSK